MSLQVHQLACTRGERELFAALEFALLPGEALRVAGPNGSGKTSLLRLLSGLASPAAGAVHWCGQNIRSIREQFGAQLIYIGHLHGVKDDLSACENVLVHATLSGQHVSREQAYQALEQLGMGARADLPTRLLSQGQRKRVALARLLLGRAQPLWILDEPFTALDQPAVQALCGTLDGHLAAGGNVIYTTHQEVTLMAASQQVLDLGQGERPC